MLKPFRKNFVMLQLIQKTGTEYETRKRIYSFQSNPEVWDFNNTHTFFRGLSVASFNPLVIFGFLSAALVLISAILVWEYLVWKNYDFFFGDDNLNIKHGVISKKHREIPLSRIQNVDIQRNIFQRLLGVAQVDLETAGGNTTEASLKYVYLETGRAIQRKFRDLEKNLKTDEEEKRELLFELEPKELFLLGVTSVNTGMFFGILALLGLGGGFLIDAAESSGIGLVTGLTVFIFFSAIATWTGSIINNVLKYFDFRLYQVEDSLEYERGLLKRSEGSIPLEKNSETYYRRKSSEKTFRLLDP